MLLALATRYSRYFRSSIWRLAPRISRFTSAAWTPRPIIHLHTPLRSYAKTPFIYLRRFSNAPTDSIPGSENDLLIRDSYVSRYHQMTMAVGEFIRLSVEGGGCSGFQYEFDLDTEMGEDDVVLERDGAKLVIDTISLDLLKGASVEFREELIRSSFRVVDIPKAESGCSCGASFALKV